MKKEIEKVIKSNDILITRRITESYFLKNYPELHKKIIDSFDNLSFTAKLYLLYYEIEKPKCLICGNDVNFIKFSHGFSKYCSNKCVGLDKNIKEKKENTMLKKYGVKYNMQSNILKEKTRQTNLERYGCENPSQNNLIKEKTRQTNLERYGVEHYLKLKENIIKREKLHFEKHGVKNPHQLKEVIEKTKQTNLEKYGYTTPAENDIIKDKIKQTNIKKYGNSCALHSPIIHKKTKKTNLERYGYSSYSKTDDFKVKVKKTKKERYKNENFNNRNKSKNTSLIKYGVDNPSKSIEIINKIQTTNNNNFKEKYSKLLLIKSEDIIINDDFVRIKKYCKKHDIFEISKSLLYSRLIFNKHENICTLCNPISENSSILETELKDFIKSLNVNMVEKNNKILNNNQEIDIYLPDHKSGIEFNGIYWHSELFKDKNYHLSKTEQCEKQGIQLLHIYDDEWVYKKEIVKSIIKSKLGFVENKIYARKCIIKEIDNISCNNFLNNNHIQGNINSNIKLGLFYNNELVSVMTFEITRKGLGNIENNNNYYNLSRFCNLLNTTIVGGASKLLNYFIKKYNPKEIITYADKRYSSGKLYESLDFKKIHVNKPSFFYFNNNKKIRYHRFNYRKDNLIKFGWFDENKSINEILLEHNIYKIYDCGTIKFQLNLNK